MTFDPNAIGQSNGNLYGLPYTLDESEVVVLPVPWDVTVSYGEGTYLAPNAILEASLQVDLYDLEYQNFWDRGIFFHGINEDILLLSRQTRRKAANVISMLEEGIHFEDKDMIQLVHEVNLASEKLNTWVKEESQNLISKGKKVILLGGDHSTPYGYISSLASQGEFGILQIDAHMDLRESYENFIYSHASIMFNAMKMGHVTSLTQVGIRDFCEEELVIAKSSSKAMHVFYDNDIKTRKFQGENWHITCEKIIATLPEKVYVSVDIDGLKPNLCPHTGTPVPGGLEYEELIYLLNLLSKSKKQIVGMDLVEVGHQTWDANVGSRLLYKMIGSWMTNQKK